MNAEYTRQNAKAWDEIAVVRNRRTRPASHYAGGGITLDRLLIEAAGNVEGKHVLQLQCSTGEETLSWAVLGARATGLDISAEQIGLARSKAAEAGLDVAFRVGDVCDPPEEVTRGTFDVVHTGGGSLVWVPDLDAWAKTVASALREGGRLLLLEEHPVAGCMSVRDGRITIEDDYFRRSKPYVCTGWRHFEGGDDAKEEKYEFGWPLGDIVTALIRSGMRIESLAEFPSDATWRFGDRLEEAASLPGSYLLVATRESR